MKVFLTILLTSIATIFFAQSDITKDTILANEYYQQALTFDNCDTQRVVYLEKAIKLYEIHPFEPKLILLKTSLASAYDCSNKEKVEKVALEAIMLAQENLDIEKHPLLIEAYLVYILTVSGNTPKKTIDYCYIALDLVEKPSIEYFTVISILTDLLYSVGNIEKFKLLIDEMEVILKNDINNEFSKYWMIFYFAKQNYADWMYNDEEVIIYAKKTLDENQKYQLLDDKYELELYGNLAMANGYLGNKIKTQFWLDKYIDNTNVENLNIEEAYTFYGCVGVIYIILDKDDLAIKYLQKSIDVITPHSEYHGEYIMAAYNNLAGVYHKTMQYEASEKSMEKCFEYGYNPRYADRYNNTLLELNKYDKGLETTQKALVALIPSFNSMNIKDNPSKEAVLDDDIEVITLLNYKSHFLCIKATTENLDELLYQGIEVGELGLHYIDQMNKRTNYSEYSQIIKNDYILSPIIDNLIAIQYNIHKSTNTKSDLNRLFNYIEQYKSNVLLKSLDESVFSEKIMNAKKVLNNHKSIAEQQLLIATNVDSIKYYENKVFEANEQLDIFFKQLQKESLKETLLYAPKYANPNDIQAGLDEHTLLVSYSIDESTENLIIYIISDKKQDVIRLNIQDLLTKVQKLTKLIQSPFLVQKKKRDEFIDLSYQVYQKLIEPLAPYRKNMDKIIIVNSSSFSNLPFEVLLSSNERKPFHELDFLINNVEISYQYSATIYHQLKQKTPITDKSLLAFAPVFENGQQVNTTSRTTDFIVDSLYRSIDNNSFVSLPNTKIEVESIAKNITAKGGTTNILIGKTAQKDALMKSITKQPYQFIHIATHGIVNFQNPKLSALICYDDENKVENAMLFANEIQMENIQADLVVLSSCESGIGQLVAGEGLLALNRSFIYSGANNVVFSLWKVNDEYTSKLMINFYKSYLENESYTTALRQAKLEMLNDKKMANPRYWASFVLIGE